MLRDVIFIIFLFKNSMLGDACADCCVHKKPSCRTSSNEELVRGNDLYQPFPPQSNLLKTKGLNQHSCYQDVLQQLQKDSIQKVEELKNNREFQEIVTELQSKLASSSKDSNSLNTANKGGFLIFVSFSLGEKALLNLAQGAKQFGATLVLKGFKDGSYKKTAQALHNIILKTGQGVLIDPELYTLFNISAAPTFILTKPFILNPIERTQTPLHDKLQGHVSAHYALDIFAKEGDLREEAHAISSKGAGS